MRVGRAAILISLLALGGLGAAQPRAADKAEIEAAQRAVAAFTTPVLTRFESEEEFRRYTEALRKLDRLRWPRAYSALSLAPQADPSGPAADEVPPCPDDEVDCPRSSTDSIVVTGARIQASNPSITNNQMVGVEEGDIVKQIGDYLLILQDGRIFVVDLRADGRRLALAARTNVYRDPTSDMWYDEMLVFGDRVLITGYSYDDQETELAVFRLGRDGRLAREGVFRISSDDYYSGSNYATRVIGDKLVVYTPLDVEELDSKRAPEWPVVRRWRAEDDSLEREERMRRGRAMLDATSIYRPLRTSLEPSVHTVSVCPLSSIAGGADLECRTTGFAGSRALEWYVSDSDVYLWVLQDSHENWSLEECETAPAPPLAEVLDATLYRVPISLARPSVAAVKGLPPDQFAMQANDGRFHALLKMLSERCDSPWYGASHLSLLNLPMTRFSNRLQDSPQGVFRTLPSLPGPRVASRFTERFVVYGGLSHFRTGLPEDADFSESEWARRARAEPGQPAYAVPLHRPSAPTRLDIRHSVIRAERVADDIVLTGYRDREGLFVSMIGLDGRSRIVSQIRLAGRYESEGRSHAFNSLVTPAGSGMLGLPTVPRIDRSNRAYWRSRASDLSYLTFGRDRRLAHVGELERRFEYADGDGEEDDEDGVPGYECEVSCIDWYGNSRPIFTDGRIFGLSGTELIEGRLEAGRIREVQRLNIALSKPRRQE